MQELVTGMEKIRIDSEADVEELRARPLPFPGVDSKLGTFLEGDRAAGAFGVLLLLPSNKAWVVFVLALGIAPSGVQLAKLLEGLPGSPMSPQSQHWGWQ